MIRHSPRTDTNEKILKIVLQFWEGKDLDIITRRLNGETLEGIAQTFGLSKQRIEQIEKRALERYEAAMHRLFARFPKSY